MKKILILLVFLLLIAGSVLVIKNKVQRGEKAKEFFQNIPVFSLQDAEKK